MAIENTRVARYQYEYRSSAAQTAALVYLYSQEDALLGVIAFSPTVDEPIPPQRHPEGYVSATLPLAALDGFTAMLRGEKPIYFSWSSAHQQARVGTGPEPVGEQELRKLFSWLYV